MTEPTVPVPVSLIERLIATATTTGVNTAAATEARALLSQPTPTAEPRITHEYEEGRFGDDGVCHAVVRPYEPTRCLRPRSEHATPPSIADMVPGTTFRARVGNAQGSNFLMVIEDPTHDLLVDSYGQDWTADDIDPSTIRDVTPPKEQP